MIQPKTTHGNDDLARLIIEGDIIYIVKTDIAGKYTYVNDYFCKKFGHSLAHYVGQDSMQSIIPEDHLLCLQTVAKCFEEPHKAHQVILCKPSVEGVVKNKWEFYGVTDSDDKVVEILCVGYEVSKILEQRNQMYDILQTFSDQNERLIGFIQTIAHDTRANMSNVIGLLEILDSESKEDSEILLSLARNSMTKLDDMLKGLYQTIQLKLNQSIELQPVMVSEVFDNILQGFKQITSQDTIEIIDTTAQKIIQTNPAYLESILFNLLTNAFKYRSPERPCKIILRLREEEFYQIIELEDNGIGIDLETKGKQLFGAYQTFHKNQDATGMGLFITKNKVKQLGGEIKVQSKVGKGSVFSIHLPKIQISSN